MKHLDLWLTFPNGNICQAGELIIDKPDNKRGGALRGEFRYSQDYLKRPEAFPLDPNALPLTEDVFSANRPKSGVHGVFEDALPDDWGRRLLIRHYNLTRQQQRVPELLSHMGSGLGALAFGNKPVESDHVSASLHTLDDLLYAAESFEKGVDLDNTSLTALFQAGSSPGGARPKTLVQDEGYAWIAKFPSIKDQFDVVSIEAATLQLAQDSGIKVPEFKCHQCSDRKVLLSRRFDVTRLGRRHIISMQSLLQADDYYMLGYGDMADLLRQYSVQPGLDLQTLYRQMLFNALIGNTDDHLKNFSMLHDDNGYRITPAYDLLPNLAKNQEHVLRFGITATIPTKNELLKLAKNYNLNKVQAITILKAI